MTTERDNLLQTINALLAERGLKQLKKLGDHTKGEIEITNVFEIYEHAKRFFTDVRFAVVFPNGSGGEFTVRFNANGEVSDGAVIVVLVNGLYAIVKQWRLPLGQWTYEVCRGFGDKLDKAHIQGELGTLKIGDLPLGTLARELGEEVMATAAISSVTHLGNIAENSGTHAVAPAYFLVQIEVDEDKLAKKVKGSEGMCVQLYTADALDMQIGKRICDSHSIVALTLANRHIDKLPRRTA